MAAISGADQVVDGAEMILEFRDTQIAKLDELECRVLDWVAAAAKAGPVAVEALPTTRIAPTLMAPRNCAGHRAAAAHHGEATGLADSERRRR